MNSYGSKFKITIFGSSHGESLGCVLEGLPNGACIDMRFVRAQLARRSAASGGEGATQRHEPDEPVLTGGSKVSRDDPSKLILDGTPLTATFFNKDVNRSDYGKFARPSHADLVSFVKYGPGHDLSGGGASSGRMTLPLVFAGAVCAGLLNERGIRAFSHVLRIGPVCDRRFDPVSPELPQDCDPYFPLINGSVRLDMERSLADAKQMGDTLSCECECAVTGLPVGLGEPFFGGVESELCRLLFSIPCLRGAEGLDEAALLALGVNQSIAHVDFLVGTPDLSIVGTTHDGREVPVFVNGNFAF